MKSLEELLDATGPDTPSTTNEGGGTQSDVPYRLDLLDGEAMLRLGAILKDGAEKYGVDNWRKIESGDHLNHALMHLMAGLHQGSQNDDHLGHAFCRLMFAVATRAPSQGNLPEIGASIAKLTFECLGRCWTAQDLTRLLRYLQDKFGLALPEDIYTKVRPAAAYTKWCTYNLKEGQHWFYVAGPYSHPSYAQRCVHVRAAVLVGIALLRKGHLVHVPHSHTDGWDGHVGSYGPAPSYDDIMRLDLAYIRDLATAMYYLGDSEGALKERTLAESLGLPIYTSLEDVPDVSNDPGVDIAPNPRSNGVQCVVPTADGGHDSGRSSLTDDSGSDCTGHT